jgi:hypothetical protein
MTPVQKAVERLIRVHNGFRPAARTTGIDPGYLWRLKTGDKVNPGDDVLKALGLEKKPVSYRRRRNGGA